MNNYYIDDVEFTNEINKSKTYNKLTYRSAFIFNQLTEEMIKNANFNGYPYEIKANMQNTAKYFFLKYWKNFNYISQNIKKLVYLKINITDKIVKRKINKFITLLADDLLDNERITLKKESFKSIELEEDIMISILNLIEINKKNILDNKIGAYSYFTKTCENGFLQEIKNYYNQNEKFNIIIENEFYVLNNYLKQEEEIDYGY